MTVARHAKKADEKSKVAGLGLEGLGSLSDLLTPAATGPTGEPVDLPLALIDEDRNQPRQTFSDEDLDELADLIKTHGVKVPICVHRNPDEEGRYVISDGARRYRASLRAGKETIPAVVGKAFSVVEQIIVNRDRLDAPPKDKARAFARLMKEHGWTQRQLAEQFGLKEPKNNGQAQGAKAGKPAKYLVSEAYISQHLALLSLPKPIDEVFDSGRCSDVTLINELAQAYRRNPAEVRAWLEDDSQELTRGSVKLLREYLEDKRRHAGADNSDQGGEEGAQGIEEPSPRRAKPARDPHKMTRPVIQVTHDERIARLLLDRRPTVEGRAWLKYEEDGQETEADLTAVQLVALLEG